MTDLSEGIVQQAKTEAATDEAVKAVVSQGKLDLQDLCEKILMFCEKVSSVDLYDYQRKFAMRVIQSLVFDDGEELTALFSRQSGKTESMSVIITGCSILLPKLAQFIPALCKFKNGLWIGIFAPIGEQATTTFERVKSKLESEFGQEVLADPEIDEEKTKDRGGIIRFTSGSLIRPMSASKQTRIESKTYHLILIEEAQDVDEDKVQRSIHPMGASTNATIVKIGTVGIYKGDFYKAIHRNKRADLKRSRKSHYEFDYKYCQRCNPYYKKYIAREKERLGEDSDAFRMSYRLEWMLERGMFITQGTLDECIDKKIQCVTEKHEGVIVAGLDFGKKSDSTVLTILELDESKVDQQGNMKKTILNWLEIEGDNYETQYAKILETVSQYKIATLLCDATGVGDPVVDRLRWELKNIAVIPIVFSSPSKDRMYKYLFQEFSNKRIVIPGHAKAQRLSKFKKFKQQMLDLEKHYVGRYMTCKHPEVKDAHDDYCDSLALACYAAINEVMPEVEQCDGSFLFSGQSLWERGRRS